MKHLFSIVAAIAFATVAHSAVVYQLKNGDNRIGAVGEVVAVEANTIQAMQCVTCSVVTAVSEYTNSYRVATTPHVRYDFTITNYDGNAAIRTNVLDRFSYADWMRGSTNLIISYVSAVSTNISENIPDGKRLKATYENVEVLAVGAASQHYFKTYDVAEGYKYLTGVTIRCQCGEGDNVRMLVK